MARTAKAQAILSRPYLNKIDLSRVNTSFDWGGGGIISTHKDVLRFLRVIFSGKLFVESATLAMMESWNKFSLPAHPYAFGLGAIQIGKHIFIDHEGAYGSAAVIDEKSDLTIAFTLNHASRANPTTFLQKLVDLIDQAEPMIAAKRKV